MNWGKWVKLRKFSFFSSFFLSFSIFFFTTLVKFYFIYFLLTMLAGKWFIYSKIFSIFFTLTLVCGAHSHSPWVWGGLKSFKTWGEVIQLCLCATKVTEQWRRIWIVFFFKFQQSLIKNLNFSLNKSITYIYN